MGYACHKARLRPLAGIRSELISLFFVRFGSVAVCGPLSRTEPRECAAGGRGRPRVTYDVTAALNAIGICVFLADIYVEVSSPFSGTEAHQQRPSEGCRYTLVNGYLHLTHGTVAFKHCACPDSAPHRSHHSDDIEPSVAGHSRRSSRRPGRTAGRRSCTASWCTSATAAGSPRPPRSGEPPSAIAVVRPLKHALTRPVTARSAVQCERCREQASICM